MSIKSETSHIVMELVHREVIPLRVGGGIGRSFGQHVDDMIRDNLLRNDVRISEFRVIINDEDWETLVEAEAKGDDVSVKTTHDHN